MNETAFDPNVLIGKRIGTYEVVSLLGSGGMGFVFRARDVSLDREIALKVLKPDLVKDREFEARFIREARVVAKLEHPNIVQIYAAGRAQGYLFLAMQLCQGETIDQRVREHGPIPVRDALRIVRKVAESLDYAHQRGLMHRDVKPTNIMVDESGSVKIMDFGLARSVVTLDGLTKTGVFYGTPEYSSPEQCQTNNIDARTDIFSLGVVMYEMLTGKVPFVAETPLALFKQISEEAPIPIRHLNPKVPRPVEALVGAMLEKDRDQRLQSARAVIEAIDRVLDGSSRPLGTPRAGSNSKPWLVGATAGVLAALAIVFFGREPAALKLPPVEPPPVEPASTDVGVKRPLKVVIADFEMLSADRQDETYRIAIPDMLISQLAQFRHLNVFTRDQMLWKIRESAPEAEGVLREYEEALLRAFSPDLYVTGTYHLRGGQLNFTVNCYKIGETRQALFTRVFGGAEASFFEMIDEAVKNFENEMRRHASTILAFASPEASDAIVSARETFSTKFAFAGMREGEAPDEDGSPVQRARRLADKEVEELRKDFAMEKSAKKAEAAAPAAAARGAHAPRRVDKLLKDERQRCQWVYSVRAAIDRVPDPRQAQHFQQALLNSEADLESLDELNDTLRSGGNANAVWQVRIVCGRHGEVSGAGPAGSCRNCGTSVKVVLEREATNKEPEGGK